MFKCHYVGWEHPLGNFASTDLLGCPEWVQETASAARLRALHVQDTCGMSAISGRERERAPLVQNQRHFKGIKR